MKYVKRTLIIVLSLIALLLCVTFVLGSFYKKELSNLLTQTLKSRFALTLTVENVDVSVIENFPNASIKLKNVLLNSDLYSVKDKPLLKASTISLSLNLLKLLHKDFEINAVSLNNAQINLVQDTGGFKNFKFKNSAPQSKKQTTGVKFDVRRFTITDTRFQFINIERRQKIALQLIDGVIKIEEKQQTLKIAFNGNLKVGGLLFNFKKGAFLQNTLANVNLSATWFSNTNALHIHSPSKVTIDQINYDANAFIEFGENKKLALKIEATSVIYDSGVKLLNDNLRKALSNFSIARPVNVKLLVATSLGVKQDPVVLLKVSSDDNDVLIGNSKVPYNHVSFKGTIVSVDSTFAKGDEENARVIFTVKGSVYEVPFTALVNAKNFTDPQIKINASLFIDGAKVKIKQTTEFQFKGFCIANVKYSGNSKKLNKEEFLSPDMFLDATLNFKNFSYKEQGKAHSFMVNGHAKLNNTELNFNRLSLKTDGGNVVLNGKVSNFAQYALGLTNGFKANINVSTNDYNLNPYLVKKPVDSNAVKAAPKELPKQFTAKSNFDFNVTLNAKKLQIRNVIANNAQIDLAYNNNIIDITSLKANLCGGTIFVKANINKLKTVLANLEFNNIDVNSLFQQFENFGQQAIISRQLKGNISLKAIFNTSLDERLEIIPSTMAGEVKLILKDGHLIEYEPLQNISNFIFHNRDFNDVTFSELNETFTINGYQMDIKELEIASNVLNIFVSGTYNFKGASNINLVIPWSNLKRRGKHYIPKSSELSAENTNGLKLNYSGMPKHMKLSIGSKP